MTIEIRKLMTWEKFVEIFKPLVDVWCYGVLSGNLYIEYKDMKWLILSGERLLFGTEIDVEEYKDNNYTHKHKYRNHVIYNFHESWFEPEFKPIEFLSKEEMEI